MRHLRKLQVARLAHSYAVVLLHHQRHTTLDGGHIRSLANKTQLLQGDYQPMGVTRQEAQEKVFERFLHALREGADHTEINKDYNRPFPRGTFAHKDVAGVRVCMEEALFKELVKIGLYGAFGHLETIDASGFQLRVVVDLDAIHPLQRQDTPGCVVVVDPGNVYGGIILEHFLEAPCIGSLGDIVYFFKDGAPELTIESHQVDKFADIDEAINYPDDKTDGAQIHAHELIDIGALHFNGNLFSGSREYSPVDLAKRCGGSSFTLQHTEYLLDWLAQ